MSHARRNLLSNPLYWTSFCWLLAHVLISLVPSALAQAEPGANSTRDAGYAVQESTPDESSLSVAQDTSSSYNVQENERSADTLSNTTPDDNEANDGPVRLARFSLVSGNVTWRGDDDVTWSEGTVNLPLRQGAQIWVTEGGRAEIQFDDGSLLRLGNDALVTLQTLYSDANGEYTALQLHSGLISLRLRHEDSIYQVDTPLASVKAAGPAQVRIGVNDGIEAAVRVGRVTVEGEQDKATLAAGDYLSLLDANTPYALRPLPAADSWELWNDERDRLLEGATESRRYLPANIALVASELDYHGSWRQDDRYGAVWCPRGIRSGWRPYYDGRWAWVNPFGWTWVSAEPWGWAPYHYGTWIHRPYGWGWVPGPVNQYWCPAVVSFYESSGVVAWAPLAPSEVYYPPVIHIGYRRRSWWNCFSIGRAAFYYPTRRNICVARPWRTVYINKVTYIKKVKHVTHKDVKIIDRRDDRDKRNNGDRRDNRGQRDNRTVISHPDDKRNAHPANHRFVPLNARVAAGATAADAGSFGERGKYRPVSQTSPIFTRGQIVAAPPAGEAPIAGPASAKPIPVALASKRNVRSNAEPPQAVLERPVFRASHRPAPRQGTATAATGPEPAAPVLENSNTFRSSNPGTSAERLKRARESLMLPPRMQKPDAVASEPDRAVERESKDHTDTTGNVRRRSRLPERAPDLPRREVAPVIVDPTAREGQRGNGRNHSEGTSFSSQTPMVIPPVERSIERNRVRAFEVPRTTETIETGRANSERMPRVLPVPPVAGQAFPQPFNYNHRSRFPDVPNARREQGAWSTPHGMVPPPGTIPGPPQMPVHRMPEPPRAVEPRRAAEPPRHEDSPRQESKSSNQDSNKSSDRGGRGNRR